MLTLTYPRLQTAQRLLKEGKYEECENFSYSGIAAWSMNRIKDSGGTINVFGKENIPTDETIVFISNHQSDFDIAIFLALIPTNKGFISKIELKKIPILRTWMKYINCVFMDRNDLRQSVKALDEAIKLVKSGKNMVIFPEGTRSKSDNIGNFKHGSFKLATKTNATIVPVTIDGSYKLKEKNNGIIKPDIVNVYIHDPIHTKNLSKEEKEVLPETVKEIIKSKLP